MALKRKLGFLVDQYGGIFMKIYRIVLERICRKSMQLDYICKKYYYYCYYDSIVIIVILLCTLSMLARYKPLAVGKDLNIGNELLLVLMLSIVQYRNMGPVRNAKNTTGNEVCCSDVQHFFYCNMIFYFSPYIMN
jgi:hypothetical protein